MRTYQTTLASLLLAALMWPAAASAQNAPNKNCNGTLGVGPFANVTVKDNKKPCTLNGSVVTGSVLVENGATLTANSAAISGAIQVKSGGDVTLNGTEVLGDVKFEEDSGNLTVNDGSSLGSISMKDSGYVKIEDEASTGELLVENSGDVTVTGCLPDLLCESVVAAILTTNSGTVNLTDARVFPGGVTVVMGGSLTICGSEIGISSTGTDGSGGVTMVESGDGDEPAHVHAGVLCDASQIEGTVIVEKGTGNVELNGTALQGDLIVIEQAGNVAVDGGNMGNGATVSDVKVEKTTGTVTLTAVEIDSDVTFLENGGAVTITSSSLGSDVAVDGNGKVTITNSSFSLEDVLISKNEGPVLVDRNCDARFTISENDDVTITNNDPALSSAACTSGFGFSDADVSKNTGGVSIDNNTGEGLFCSDNSPAPVEGPVGNTITFSDGQCSGF